MELKTAKKDYRFRLPVSLYNQIFKDTSSRGKSEILIDILDNYVKGEIYGDKTSKI